MSASIMAVRKTGWAHLRVLWQEHFDKMFFESPTLFALVDGENVHAHFIYGISHVLALAQPPHHMARLVVIFGYELITIPPGQHSLRGTNVKASRGSPDRSFNQQN